MNVSPRYGTFLFVLAIGCLLIPSIAHAKLTPAWLLINKTGDDSVMTLGADEKDALIKAGWKIEGEGSVESENVDGSALLNRMVRSTPKGTDRRLEFDPALILKSKDAGFSVEGWLGFVRKSRGPGSLAVVQMALEEKRLWVCTVPSQKAAEANGWKRQGVQFWLWPAKPSEGPSASSTAPR